MSSSIKGYLKLSQKWGCRLLAHKNHYLHRDLSKVAAKNWKKCSNWVCHTRSSCCYVRGSWKWLVDGIESFPPQQRGTVEREMETSRGPAQRTATRCQWQSVRLLKPQTTEASAVVYASIQAKAEELLTRLFRCLSAWTRITTKGWLTVFLPVSHLLQSWCVSDFLRLSGWSWYRSVKFSCFSLRRKPSHFPFLCFD